MSLHHDLLEQAEHLAKREQKKPRQASLRRAVSTAYYSLFHMLTAEGTIRMVPKSPGVLRDQVQRAFAHGEMRSACEQLLKSPNSLSRLLAAPIEIELKTVASAFIELQQQRHTADYDLTQSFDRLEVLGIIDAAKTAMAAWAKVRTSSNSNVFLAALLLNSRWNR